MSLVKCPKCGEPAVRISIITYSCTPCNRLFDWPEPEDKNATTMPKQSQSFDEWALVELFGHQKIVGRVTDSTIAGGAFLRVDVPEIKGEYASPAYTRFFSPGAIYSINPLSEETARALLIQSRFRNEPVDRFDLPQIAEKVQDAGEDNRYGGTET